MEQLTLGIAATSRKPDERRLAIHPDHLGRIDEDLRRRIYLEQGYGEHFGVPDGELARLVGGLRPREQIFEECDVVVLPKPLAADLEQMRPGAVLWGWPHLVQDEELAQAAIDRRLTVIAWESMNHWTADGAFSLHVFHRNNEIAGYASVLHALSLTGTAGAYGPRRRAAVIGFGSTGRGAVTGLFALDVAEVDVLTQRDVAAVAAPMAPARLVTYRRGEERALHVEGRGDMAQFLAEHEIVVNCILQDTDAPLIFIYDDELSLFARSSLIVDVSCDEGMGFEWARPTSFAEPMTTVGDGVRYYAVDHSPSYLWNSATWEISEALLPFLGTVMAGPDAWQREPTIARALEIRDGVVENQKILSFQHRAPEYPHPRT